MKTIILLCALFIVLVGCTQQTEQANTNETLDFEPLLLTIGVFDEVGKDLAGANVSVVSATDGITYTSLVPTDSVGNSSFLDMVPGKYAISISKEGYTSKLVVLNLAGGEINLTFGLMSVGTPEPQPAPEQSPQPNPTPDLETTPPTESEITTTEPETTPEPEITTTSEPETTPENTPEPKTPSNSILDPQPEPEPAFPPLAADTQLALGFSSKYSGTRRIVSHDESGFGTVSVYGTDTSLFQVTRGDAVYGMTGQGVGIIDTDGKYSTLPLLQGNTISWAVGVTYDTTRNRAILATLGGQGFLYACTPAGCSEFASLNYIDLSALEYLPADDLLYGIPNKKTVEKLYVFNSEGELQEEQALSQSIPGYCCTTRTGVQIKRNGTQLVYSVFDGDKPLTYHINPVTGDVSQ
jgi:hypothetical protein